MRWQSSPGLVPVPLERRSCASSRQSVSPSGYRSGAALPIFFLYLPAHEAGWFHLRVIGAGGGKRGRATPWVLGKPSGGRGRARCNASAAQGRQNVRPDGTGGEAEATALLSDLGKRAKWHPSDSRSLSLPARSAARSLITWKIKNPLTRGPLFRSVLGLVEHSGIAAAL